MNNNDSNLGPKSVRMFYYLVLKQVIPHKPGVGLTGEKGSVALSDKRWNVEFCESLNLQLEALLEPQNFQIAFDRKTGVRPLEKQQTTYFVPFLVSKVLEFKTEDIIIPTPGCTGFKIEERALSSARETLAQDIRDALREKVAIHELIFSMATSRNFGFEIYYEGSFRVKREFSDDEIASEGGVRDALESFFDEIESAIQPFDFEITSTPSTHRRSHDNEYIFSVYYAQPIGISERDVRGEGSYAISGDASTDEINEYGVDFDNTMDDETEEYLNSVLEENLPPYADLISCAISYVDDSEESIEVCDELIHPRKLYPECFMLKRPESELQIVRSRDPLLTIEVDIDCIPKNLHGYGELIVNAISPIAAESPNMRATIYVYHGLSNNFQQQTWSAFFGVAGDKMLLDVLLNAFRAAQVVNVKVSDYIDPSTATKDFHVQDGYVWRPYEAGTWYTDSQDEANLADDAALEIDEIEFAEEVTSEELFRTSSPSRFRIARSDATIETIRKKIEAVFGLPEGSVVLCGPKNKPLRGDATIATLRKRWE